MRKYQLLIPSILAILCFCAFPVYAQDTQVSDLVGTTSTPTTTTDTSATTTTTNSLKLTISSQTENPSFSITFTDPSTDKKGVQLETDSKGFIDITSPYTFPALSIGKHSLEFKYVDENGTTQLYDTNVIIIPRVPIIAAPVITDTSITISGTGLANADLIVVVSSGSVVINKSTTTDDDGKWSLNIDRKYFEEEVYSINAYVRKYGYASNLSDTTKFTLSSTTSVVSKNNFEIKNFSWTTIRDLFLTYKYYILTGIVALMLGLILGTLVRKQNNIKHEAKVEANVAKEFEKLEPKGQGITLRDKLAGKGAPEASKAPEIKPEEKQEEEKVVNKIDFLKDFKKFDPDNDKGEEQKPQVEVSLTSKK